MENRFVITVARGFGTGGKVIASRVAERLGISCYENRILTLASQLSGYDESEFVDYDEKLSSSLWISKLKKMTRLRTPKPEKNKFRSNDKIFEYQKRIIEELADNESCVIVGKCADYILKERKNVVSVYIEAPREYCRTRVMNRMMLPASTADKLIEETDSYRADYYKYYTHGNYWTNPVNYDLTLNPDRLGQDACIDMILHCLELKMKIIHEEE